MCPTINVCNCGSQPEYVGQHIPPCTRPNKLLENGSTDSPGPTGEPSRSDRLSERTVRLHQGLSHLSVASLSLTRDVQGTFTALKRGDSDGYTVMLSCALTSTEYAALLAALEGSPTALGQPVSVELEFAPMTPNLVRYDIVVST